MRQETSARPASGSATITNTGSATAVSLARSTSDACTGADAISSGASSPDTMSQASEAETCAAMTTMVGASASAVGSASLRNSTTAIGIV